MPPPMFTSSEWRVAPRRPSSAHTCARCSSVLLLSVGGMVITPAPRMASHLPASGRQSLAVVSSASAKSLSGWHSAMASVSARPRSAEMTIFCFSISVRFYVVAKLRNFRRNAGGLAAKLPKWLALPHGVPALAWFFNVSFFCEDCKCPQRIAFIIYFAYLCNWIEAILRTNVGYQPKNLVQLD